MAYYPPGLVLLWNRAVAIDHTGGTSEVSKVKKTIPAGIMGLHGRIEWEIYYSWTDSANDKTLKVKFGGTTFFSRLTTATQTTGRVSGFIANRGSAAVQVGSHSQAGDGWGEAAAAVVTATVNTALNASFTVTCQLENSGEHIVIQAYTIKVFRSN